MKPADIDRVFGRGRLRMVTGDHVEVFREHAAPGERRRYTKRFLATAAGDFSEWTGREWRILARLVGHGIKPVPDVVRFDRGASDRAALVQTYDAGITVDHWATLLPVVRDGTTLRNIFEDCAHWWALARHSLIALDAIHELRLVHLDLKADNVCIPVDPDFDPASRDQVLRPRFDDIALIDFAFSLVSGERLDSPLPIAEQADYEYQSPRLLRALEHGRAGDLAPTRQLDWRCDLFSLAAMLWRYLPELEDTTTGAWTRTRHAKARALVRRLIEAHDGEVAEPRPHAALIALASEPLAQPALRESLQRGWTLALDSGVATAASPTPVTRIAAPIAAAGDAFIAAPHAPLLTPVVATPLTSPLTLAGGHSTANVAAAGSHDEPVFASVADRSAPPAAPPLGDPGDEAQSLAVDPTDVALRMRVRRREREQRVRRIAWSSGVGAVALSAAAAVAWLEPTWVSWRGARDLQVALASEAAARAGSVVGVAAPKPRGGPAIAAIPQPGTAATVGAALSPSRGPTAGAASTPSAAPTGAATPTSPAPADAAAPRDRSTPATIVAAVPTEPGIDARMVPSGRGTSDLPDEAATPRDGTNDDRASAEAVKPASAPTLAGSADAAPATAAGALAAAAPPARSLPPATAPSREASRLPARALAAAPARSSGARQPADSRSVSAAPTRLARANGSAPLLRASAAAPAARAGAAAPLARASVTAPHASRLGTPGSSRWATASPARAAAANPWPGDGAPIPWAVAGRTAPRAGASRSSPTLQRGVVPATMLASATASPQVRAEPSSPPAVGVTSAPMVGVTSRATTNAGVAATNAGGSTSGEAAPPPVALASARQAAAQEQMPSTAAPPPPRSSSTAPAAAINAPIDYASRADDLMANQVPRLAQRAERLVARVLFTASRSANVPGDEAIRSAAGAVGRDSGDGLADLPVSAREAQRLAEAARSEYARRGSTPEALALQARAFGANPLDAETAGNLAFLLLRQRPAQPEAARQLALLALTLHGARAPERRIEDWATLAIASALSGRERDSRNAFLVALALASNLDRQCKAALDVYALYGERLRAPIETMLQSASASGRSDAGPSCDWPAQRMVGGSMR